jgi:Histidine kinase-, DNA gyrase B-, and HSP90-like ATPase
MTRHDIVPTHLVVKAMRDNGYKNAAYAIAELMDNAIQAKATKIELLCCEEIEMLLERKRSRVKEVAVLDNGVGMDAQVLRLALQFGNGTHLSPKEQTGMGRFGMGLPSSSISQCRRVDVWSWQNGVENALYSYLDLDEIESDNLVEVPEPIIKNIPIKWLGIGDSFDKSGTLVVWSKIDKCLWRTSQTIIDNSEHLIGRMYRYFLTDNRIIIRLSSFDGTTGKTSINRYAEPNDPCYLMKNTSCNPPFNNDAMFEQWGEVKEFLIRFKEKDNPVKITFSIAKEKARVGLGTRNPGDLPHGKHAAKNVGVSIVRAERELDLDLTWSNPSDPRERWWGVEVSFEPALDELFGVTNNKQSARNFSELAKTDLESLLDENQSLEIITEILSADEDPRLPLFQIANHIRKNISSMAALIRAQTERPKSTKRHDPPPEKKATEIIRQRQEEGFVGESDSQENNSPEVRKEEIIQELVNEGVAQKTAEELAATTVDEGFKFTFTNANLSGAWFFDIKSRGGSMIISLNVNHPAYTHLIEVLDEEPEEMSLDEIQAKFGRAKEGLKLLLMAWARYEDELPDGRQRTEARNARWSWGKMAEDFMLED